MSGRLASKVIVVTGATSGIGAAVATRAGAEGATVVLGARRPEPGHALVDALKVEGVRARFVPTDVTSPDSCDRLIDAAVSGFGRLDGAFNNAGDVVAPGSLVDIDDAAVRQELEINLLSVFSCMRAELAAMVTAGRGGSIVNNASIGGVAGIGGLSAYAAAKHGVVGLTRSAALEMATQGIRVNALVTGNVDTPLYRRLSGVGDDPHDDLPAPNPTGRVATPEEIAAFVVYLLTDEAAFITGAALPIDGGATAG